MSLGEFEDACRDLLRRDGSQAERIGRSNDQVVDVLAMDALIGSSLVQCKHTTIGKKVGTQVLYQANRTARPVDKVATVVIATSGDFTSRPATSPPSTAYISSDARN